jgi:hypothetical protein
MLRTRLWVLLCLTGLGQMSLFGCGEDEGASKPRQPGDGGSSTLGGEGPSETLGGNAADSSGGTAASDTGGAPVNTGGAPFDPEGGANLGGGLGAGGATDPALGEQLELCARLSGNTIHAFNVEQGYAKAAIKDCRVTWVIPRKDDLVPFQNALLVSNLELWGCQGKPVENFALVYGTPELSQGDVTILIDEYMAAADLELELSPPEFDDMKAALERLAEPLIASASTEPSQPNCAVESAGGAAGAGGGTADIGVGGAGGAVQGVGQGGTQ